MEERDRLFALARELGIDVSIASVAEVLERHEIGPDEAAYLLGKGRGYRTNLIKAIQSGRLKARRIAVGRKPRYILRPTALLNWAIQRPREEDRYINQAEAREVWAESARVWKEEDEAGE